MNQRLLGSTNYPITFPLETTSGKPATGVTPTVVLSKNGGAFAAAAGAVAEIGFGWYALASNATDRNTLGDFLVYATAPGCYPFGPAQYEITSIDPFAPLPTPPAPPPPTPTPTPVINVTQTNTDDDDSAILTVLQNIQQLLNVNVPPADRIPI